MQFGAQRREFKVVHRSGAAEAIVTVKILTHLKEVLYNHTWTIEKSALKVRPHPPKGASLWKHTFTWKKSTKTENSAEEIACFWRPEYIFSWPLKWAASSTGYWFHTHERYKNEGVHASLWQDYRKPVKPGAVWQAWSREMRLCEPIKMNLSCHGHSRISEMTRQWNAC